MDFDPQLVYISILRDKNGAIQINSSAPLYVCYTDYDALSGDKDFGFTIMQCTSVGEPYKYEYSVTAGGAVETK